MRIIPNRTFWLTFSSLMVLPSVIGLFLFGLKFSADFTEGTLLSLRFKAEDQTPVTQESVRTGIESFSPKSGDKLTAYDLKKASTGVFILRVRRLAEEDSALFLTTLKEKTGDFELLESRNVSPVYAQSFRNRAILAVIVASIMIILYITYAFRQVSRGIKSWKLGVSAVIALVHDTGIVMGVFAFLGHYFSVEVDALFITAILSVMGYSVHDTIIVFDRVRENVLHKSYHETFDEVAEKALHQTMARSINTSLSTLLVLIPMLLLGANEIFYFILALTMGIVVGTYSSIFVATPLLTIFQKSQSEL